MAVQEIFLLSFPENLTLTLAWGFSCSELWERESTEDICHLFCLIGIWLLYFNYKIPSYECCWGQRPLPAMEDGNATYSVAQLQGQPGQRMWSDVPRPDFDSEARVFKDRSPFSSHQSNVFIPSWGEDMSQAMGSSELLSWLQCIRKKNSGEYKTSRSKASEKETWHHLP